MENKYIDLVAWAFKDFEDVYYTITRNQPNSGWNIIRPLTTFRDVNYVIQNNALPNKPLLYVVWNKNFTYKVTRPTIAFSSFDVEVPIFSAEELLNELTTPIEEL